MIISVRESIWSVGRPFPTWKSTARAQNWFSPLLLKLNEHKRARWTWARLEKLKHAEHLSLTLIFYTRESRILKICLFSAGEDEANLLISRFGILNGKQEGLLTDKKQYFIYVIVGHKKEHELAWVVDVTGRRFPRETIQRRRLIIFWGEAEVLLFAFQNYVIRWHCVRGHLRPFRIAFWSTCLVFRFFKKSSRDLFDLEAIWFCENLSLTKKIFRFLAGIFMYLHKQKRRLS